MAWIRELKAPGGQITLPFGTPFMIVGDLNVYDTDPARQLHTLISGEILDQAQYGPSFQPDWDNTPLTDVLPRHNASGAATWTWRDDGQRYNPGALDRIIYSDSVLEVVHAFVLNTTIMTPQELVSSGLEWGDVLLTPKAGDYDHLPIVVDVLPITP